MEIWKDIVGYEGLYQISNLGRVKNLRHGKERIMRACVNGSGYYQLSLVKNEVKKNYRIGRLLAQTFIPNPENKPCINHKDLNKINDLISNLEWNTYSENTKHARNNDAGWKKREYEIRECEYCHQMFIANKVYARKYCTRVCSARGRVRNPETRRAMSLAKLKKVIQKDMNGKKIKVWGSLNEAAAYFNCTNGQISNAVNGRGKTCRGFKWELL